MAKIAITGYFGSGNLGDEAILAGMLRSIQNAVGKNLEVVVFSDNPQRTHALHGVEAIDNYPQGTRLVTECLKRMGLRQAEATAWWTLRGAHVAARRALAACDVLCIGGGGILSDELPRILPRYLGKLPLAKKAGTKVMIYGVGAIGLDTLKGREYARNVISQADAITVRDKESRDRLIEAGVPPAKITVTADPAIHCLPASQERTNEIFEMEGVPIKEQMTGMLLAPYFDSIERAGDTREKLRQYRDVLADSIKRLIQDENRNLVFLPFHHSGDLKFIESVLDQCDLTSHPRVHVFRTMRSPSEILGVMERFSSLLTIRLHGMILSAMAGVPFVPISYSPKTESFLKRIDYHDYALDVGDFSSETLLGAIGRVEKDKEQIIESLRTKMALMKDSERANTSILKKLLEGKHSN